MADNRPSERLHWQPQHQPVWEKSMNEMVAALGDGIFSAPLPHFKDLKEQEAFFNNAKCWFNTGIGTLMKVLPQERQRPQESFLKKAYKDLDIKGPISRSDVCKVIADSSRFQICGSDQLKSFALSVAIGQTEIKVDAILAPVLVGNQWECYRIYQKPFGELAGLHLQYVLPSEKISPPSTLLVKRK